MQSFGCVLKRRCTERCTFSENLPEGWNGGTALEKKQEDGRFCRAYLRTMDPEQAAAEIGRRDGYAMLGQKGTQQKLERMRCDAAAQLKREDVLRQLARLAFGRVDDAVQLALRRGELDTGGLELSAVSELRVSEKGIEVKSASSSVEEDAAALVRKAFATKAEKAEKPEIDCDRHNQRGFGFFRSAIGFGGTTTAIIENRRENHQSHIDRFAPRIE